MWPVGVILLQFVLKKYNIFNTVRLVNKPANIKNTYFINYLIQLATFFGDKVIDECSRLGYELKLPSDIEHVRIRDLALMYKKIYMIEMATMISLTIFSISYYS